MSGGFRRSSLFGLIGVFVVAAVVIVIATQTGQGEANPKLTLGLIFGVIGIFMVGLLVLQRADLDRAAGGESRGASRAAAEAAPARDPTRLTEPELWAALATGPIDADALRAREEMWDVGRRSNRLGFVIVILILLTVPAVYLLESFVPLLVGGPLIAIAALWGGLRAIGPGGEIESSFERTDRAMAPLGLKVTETPKGGFEMRYPSQPGFDYRLRGWTVLSGERHGRRVAVRLGGHEDAGTTEVIVATACRPYEARSKRVEVAADGESILVRRHRGGREDWLCDLWLAEQLASG
ncbi:MAG: hypothetical protein U0R71_00510 [Solirubrobacterales bacterium]